MYFFGEDILLFSKRWRFLGWIYILRKYLLELNLGSCSSGKKNTFLPSKFSWQFSQNEPHKEVKWKVFRSPFPFFNHYFEMVFFRRGWIKPVKKNFYLESSFEKYSIHGRASLLVNSLQQDILFIMDVIIYPIENLHLPTIFYGISPSKKRVFHF